MKQYKKARGFTLIELLVVIGIIAVLAAIVIIAINPARQFAQARDSQRQSNVETILNAIGQHLADSKGVFATGGCPTLTASTTLEIQSGTGGADLSCLVPTYIPTALPYDPNVSTAHWNSSGDYDTGYKLVVDSTGRYTISAPGAEITKPISITR